MSLNLATLPHSRKAGGGGNKMCQEKKKKKHRKYDWLILRQQKSKDVVIY